MSQGPDWRWGLVVFVSWLHAPHSRACLPTGKWPMSAPVLRLIEEGWSVVAMHCNAQSQCPPMQSPATLPLRQAVRLLMLHKHMKEAACKANALEMRRSELQQSHGSTENGHLRSMTETQQRGRTCSSKRERYSTWCFVAAKTMVGEFLGITSSSTCNKTAGLSGARTEKNCSWRSGESFVSASKRTNSGELRPRRVNSASAEGSVAEKSSTCLDSAVCFTMSRTCMPLRFPDPSTDPYTIDQSHRDRHANRHAAHTTILAVCKHVTHHTAYSIPLARQRYVAALGSLHKWH
jgi:hypothetical protein